MFQVWLSEAKKWSRLAQTKMQAGRPGQDREPTPNRRFDAARAIRLAIAEFRV